jgi:hypothetical protein
VERQLVPERELGLRRRTNETFDEDVMDRLVAVVEDMHDIHATESGRPIRQHVRVILARGDADAYASGLPSPWRKTLSDGRCQKPSGEQQSADGCPGDNAHDHAPSVRVLV